MMKESKLLLFVAIVAGITLTVFVAVEIKTASQIEESIRIAINVWPGYPYAFVAKEKGFLEKNGVNVELILTQEYSEAQKLYLNGKVDGIFEVYSDTILHNSEGIPTKVVYVSDYSTTGDVVIGRVSSIEELRGKKISVEGINSFSHLFVLKVLESYGIKEADVYFENIPAHEALIALEQDRIDAAHTWEPTKSAALQKGYKVVFSANDSYPIIIDVLSFNSRIVEERSDAIQAIVNSLIEARNFVDTNREESLRIMATAEGMTVVSLEHGLDGVRLLNMEDNIDTMRSGEMRTLYDTGRMIIDFYLNRGMISMIPELDNIIDPRFVNSYRDS